MTPITFRLRRGISEETIKEELNSHFWYEKLSKDGDMNKIRGCVVYPKLVGEVDNEDKEVNKDIKDVRIEGSNYELQEDQILSWLKNYGTVESRIEEEAIVVKDDRGGEDVVVGTGTYLVQMKINKLIPNILPIQGKKIKVWYQSVKKQCRDCFSYHKREQKCNKKSFAEYLQSFKDENPRITAGFYCEGDGSPANST